MVCVDRLERINKSFESRALREAQLRVILPAGVGTFMISIDHSKRRIIRIAGVGISILALLLFLRQCSLDPTSGFDMRYGLAESNYKLARDSRLPRWLQLPIGLDRSDITVEFIYFLSKWKIAAIDNKTGKIFFSAEADMKLHPTTEARSKAMKQGTPCPYYYVISVAGIEEVIAHIEKGNIVYIVEPSEVTSAVDNNAEIMKRCETLKYYD